MTSRPIARPSGPERSCHESDTVTDGDRLPDDPIRGGAPRRGRRAGYDRRGHVGNAPGASPAGRYSSPSRLSVPPDPARDAGARGIFFIVEPAGTNVEIARLIHAGQIRPVVDAVLPSAGAREPFERGLAGHVPRDRSSSESTIPILVPKAQRKCIAAILPGSGPAKPGAYPSSADPSIHSGRN